jgi:DNA-binding transcriptional LysR family regulator
MSATINKTILLGLRVFAVAAQSLSVTKAAEQLHVTPGAVSQQLSQLEELLQVDLFVREHRRMSLTAEGQSLALQLHACFHQMERALNEIAPQPSTNSLRLKLMPSLAIRWLLPRLASFYALYPDIQLDIATVPRVEDATLEQADFAVRLGTGQWDDAEADLLFGDALIPVCAPSVAARLKTPVDVPKETLLHSMMRPDGWDIWLAAQDLQGMTSAKGPRFANAALAYQAAIEGLGVAIAQYPYVEADLAAGRLVAPFPLPVTTDQGYYLVCAKRRANQPLIKMFRKWMRELPRTLVAIPA